MSGSVPALTVLQGYWLGVLHIISWSSMSLDRNEDGAFGNLRSSAVKRCGSRIRVLRVYR